MTKLRKLVVALEVETDLNLNLLKNRWGWRCCDKFVRVNRILTEKLPKRRSIKK